MPSDEAERLEFFVDRSLGRSIVDGLRAEGLQVHSMADIYGEAQAQRLPDEVWLSDAVSTIGSC